MSSNQRFLSMEWRYILKGGNILKNLENSPNGLYARFGINDLIVSNHPDMCQYHCVDGEYPRGDGNRAGNMGIDLKIGNSTDA